MTARPGRLSLLLPCSALWFACSGDVERSSVGAASQSEMGPTSAPREDDDAEEAPALEPSQSIPSVNGTGDDRAVSGTCYPTCSSSDVDSDGDGWGFEAGVTCLVEGGAPFRDGNPCRANSPAGTGEPEPMATPAERKFVGNITTRNQIRPDFLDYWDQITPENEGKWASVEPNRDQMNWSALDDIVGYAQRNGIPFKQHTFVWGDQSPRWMAELSRDEQREETEEWIRLFCERYPETELIDVVNEPDHKTPAFIEALGGAGQSGHDWVLWAFETARRHCPNAELILNDYNVLRWDTDNFLSIARKVADAGLLDAIGCQAHGLEDISLDELRTSLERIADVGVKVYISEFDLDIADDTEQLNVMKEQFPLFYEHPAVAGITLWGYVHGSTWVADSGLIRNGQPRPALTWLMEYLGRGSGAGP